MNQNITRPSSNDARRKSCRAPGPKGGMLLGSLKDFQHDPIGFLTRSVETYGDIVRFRFGPVTAHLVNRPEYVEHVLRRGAGSYDKRTRSVSKLHTTCGDSLLSSDGEQWLRHRRLIHPFLQTESLRTFEGVIDSAIDDMIARWRGLDAARQEVDIVSEMMKVTMTIAARVFFSTDIERETELIERALDDVLQDTWRRINSPIDLASVSSLFHRRPFRKALSKIDSVVYRIIDDRKRTGADAGDLLSALLHACEDAQENRFSDRELRDAVVTLLLAGHETTANALARTFYLIAGDPAIENRLRDEAKRASASEPQSFREAKMAFSEAIRIYPSIWIIERRATVTDCIDGYRIPRGSTLLVSPYLLHRHRQWWSDPERFDPDRFAPDQVESRPRNAYLPFGVGPHKCIGEHMALMVATRILSRVYREFSPRLVSNQTPGLVPGITLRHSSELRMTLRRIATADEDSRSEAT